MAESQINNNLEKDPGTSGRNMSRRAFLGVLGTGAAALVIDRISGGALVATAKELAAFAAGDGNSTTVQFITIDVNQIAITVRDAKDSRKFVKDAVVRIQSLADSAVDGSGNHLMAEAKTNDQGVAVFDVTGLAEDPDNKKYDFYGRVFVTKPGWRDFEIGAMRFLAGQATGVYFQEDDGKPYLRCLTFDDYDIQYTEQTFSSTSKTLSDHTMVATVVTPAGASKSEIAYWTGDPRTGDYIPEANAQRVSPSVAVDRSATSFYKDANGEFAATHTFTHPFMDPAAGNAFFLGVGKPLHLHVWVNRADRFRADAKLAVMEGVIEEPEHGSDDEKDNLVEVRIQSEEDHYEGVNVDLPEGLPGLTKFNLWVPSFPGTVMAQPNGSFSVNYGASWGIIKEKGGQTEDEQREAAEAAGGDPPDSSTWEKMPKEDVVTQIENKFNEMSKQMQLFSEAANRAKAPGTDFLSRAGTQAQSSASFTLSIGAFMQGIYETDKEPNPWQGEMGLYGKVAFAYNWSQLFFIAGTIPVNLILDIYASIAVRYSLGYQAPSLSKIHEGGITNGFAKTPFKFYIALTVSVGINGVASVGVRGSAYLYLTRITTSSPQKSSTEIELGAEITIVLELLLFHYEITVASVSYPDKGRAAQLFSQGETQAAVSASGLPELDAMFRPFTQEGLLGSSEIEIQPASSVSPLSEDAEQGTGAEDAAYESTYSPYVEGNGIQSPDAAELMTMSDDASYTPSTEWCFIRGAFANAHLQLIYSNIAGNVYPAAVFRLVTARILDRSTYEYKERTRLGVSEITGMSSGKITLHTAKALCPMRTGWDVADRWDLDYTAISLTTLTQQSTWAVATVSTTTQPTSVSDSMMKSKLIIAFNRQQWWQWVEEFVFDNDELTRGEQYGHPYNLSFTELPDGGVGFACAVAAFNSPTDTAPAAQYLFSISFSYDGSSWIANKPSSLVEVKKPSTSPSIEWGMLAIDSLVAFPPQTTALHYDAGAHMFNIGYTVQISETGGAEPVSRRLLYFTVHKDGNQNTAMMDMYPDRRYNFTGNLTRFDRDNEGIMGHALIARFTGEMEGVDPDESPVNKTIAFIFVDYAWGVTGSTYYIGDADVGPLNKDVDYGGFQLSPDGNLLFFTKTFDGQVPESAYESDQVTQTDSPEEKHQIWAARYIGGHFTDPFPLVDLTCSADSFQYVPNSGNMGGSDDSYVFFYSHITDTSAGSADTYMVRMPYLKRLTLVDIAPVEPAIPKGKPLELEVTARNDGNVILSSFKVKFTDPKVGFEQTVTCDCSYATYIPNVYDGQNLTTKDVEPGPEAKSSVFFPGFTNTYAMKVDLPADYPAGAHDLQAVILEDSYVAPQAETYGEWVEDEAVAANAQSYADSEPLVFSMANGSEADLSVGEPDEGEEAAHASDYVEG